MMSIFSEEEVLKVLNIYNPWWKIGELPKDYIQKMKRLAFYDVKDILMKSDIRRFVVLSGARRVGKTTILYQLIDELLNHGVNEKNIVYMSLDNPILKFGSLDKILEIYVQNISPKGEIYIFLDEIQYSTEWNSWLKVFYDQNINWKIVATGSASPLIDKGVSESGVGRWITITVPTLSFYEYCKLINKEDKLTGKTVFEIINNMPQKLVKEILKAQGTDSITEILSRYESRLVKIEEKIPKDFSITKLQDIDTKKLKEIVGLLDSVKEDFARYLTIGGFPELALSKNDRNAQRILREDIVDKVLKRDMPELFNIRNISVLEKVFLYLCFESSNIINYSTMSQTLEGVSLPTLQDYIKYLQKANLIYISEMINNTGTKILKSNPKIYIVDSAIRNAVLMKDNVLIDAIEMGYVVETAVYRHVYTYMQNKTGNIGYYREKDKDKEIDIVTESVKENMYIEVKYRENPEVKKDNPIYTRTGDSDRLFIITKNSEDCEVAQLENGKRLVKIPAYAFLYLIGLEEARK